MLAGTGVWKISSVACGVSSKNRLLYYQESLISRINEVYVFFNKISLCSDILLKKNNNINFIYNHLFCCDHTCYCVNMVSVTSALKSVGFKRPTDKIENKDSSNYNSVTRIRINSQLIFMTG